MILSCAVFCTLFESESLDANANFDQRLAGKTPAPPGSDSCLPELLTYQPMIPNNTETNHRSSSSPREIMLSPSPLSTDVGSLSSSPARQLSSSNWTLPSVLMQRKGSLSNVSVEELQACLQPILSGLEQLDSEALLHLDRVPSGGARLRDR